VPNTAAAWAAAGGYALQIYFDFSGYSDMAIGLARMLNVRFPLNFASPYQARNIAEFWRRWHITLGVFLREYVYFPLGGSRCGALRHSGNLLATMLLCGLWHGAAWRFVLWGGLHGLYLVLHAHCRVTLPRALAQALMLLAVIVAWVPFRASSGAAAQGMLAGMAGLHGVALPQMVVHAMPVLGTVATPVPVLPFLGDARTLSFPEVSACLLLGWCIVLLLPHVHELSEGARGWALTSGFAFSVQALFFASHVAPFLYFRF
jgi:D-alanyl-lipoteichoic acid acyltransferase DltB (MBOAT superfamily)